MTQSQEICSICRGKGQIQRIVGREIKIDICSNCGGKGYVRSPEAREKGIESDIYSKGLTDPESVSLLFDEIISFPIAAESDEIVEIGTVDKRMEEVLTAVTHIKEEERIKQPSELANKYQELIDQLRQYIESTRDLDKLLDSIERSNTLGQLKKAISHLQKWQTFAISVVLWMTKTEKTWDRLSGGVETPLRSEWIQLKRQLLQRLDMKKEQIEARIGERSAQVIDTSIENYIQQMVPNSQTTIEELARFIGGETLTIEKRLLYLLYNKDMKAVFDSASRKITKI
ncbi:MAG: hypothetical protein ACFFCQ_15195 [Promethearchaeota archaeon]